MRKMWEKNEKFHWNSCVGKYFFLIFHFRNRLTTIKRSPFHFSKSHKINFALTADYPYEFFIVTIFLSIVFFFLCYFANNRSNKAFCRFCTRTSDLRKITLEVFITNEMLLADLPKIRRRTGFNYFTCSHMLPMER